MNDDKVFNEQLCEECGFVIQSQYSYNGPFIQNEIGCYCSIKRAAAEFKKNIVKEEDWRIGFFERWRDEAKLKGYAGIADAVNAAPTLVKSPWTNLPPDENAATLRAAMIEATVHFQLFESIAAAIIPYPGGVIAFGSRDAILSMLSNEDSA